MTRISCGGPPDAVFEMTDSTDGTEDQPGAQHNQTQVKEHQRRKQGHHFLDPVIARGRDQRLARTEHSEHCDTGAQRRQCSSFLSEEHLDFPKDDIVQLGWFVRFRTHFLFNLIDSARNRRKIELNSWNRLYRSALAAAVSAVRAECHER